MLELRRRFSRFRVLLTIVVAIALSAVPAASFAQVDLCHRATDAHIAVAHKGHAAESKVSGRTAGHESQVASIRKTSTHHTQHSRGAGNCCGNGCVLCTSAIVASLVSLPDVSLTVPRRAEIELPVRGQSLAPPLGPPRFQI